LVGSANATASGLGLRPNSNSEVGTVVEQTDENILLINNLFSGSIKINDLIYNELKDIVAKHATNREKINWPRSVLNVIEKIDYSIEKLFLSECFQTSGVDIFLGEDLTSEEARADLSLLGMLNGRLTEAMLVELFISTKIFKWLYSTLSKNSGSLSFNCSVT
jgi:hypothetical protein